MESCARVVGMFPDYADGGLSSPESGRVASHLEVCAPCARRVARQREILTALDHLPQVMPPDRLREAIMSRVAAAPLRVPGIRRSHLRLVKVLFWMTLASAAGAAAAGGSFLLGRDFAGRTGLLEPAVYADWIESFGRLAFSFLMDIATRAQIPNLFSSTHNPFAWGGVLTSLLATGFAIAAIGVGVLATARVLIGFRGR
jgi:anti-sigma factor RsiW